jgi:hypothetical protein
MGTRNQGARRGNGSEQHQRDFETAAKTSSPSAATAAPGATCGPSDAICGPSDVTCSPSDVTCSPSDATGGGRLTHGWLLGAGAKASAWYAFGDRADIDQSDVRPFWASAISRVPPIGSKPLTRYWIEWTPASRPARQ